MPGSGLEFLQGIGLLKLVYQAQLTFYGNAGFRQVVDVCLKQCDGGIEG